MANLVRLVPHTRIRVPFQPVIEPGPTSLICQSTFLIPALVLVLEAAVRDGRSDAVESGCAAHASIIQRFFLVGCFAEVRIWIRARALFSDWEDGRPGKPGAGLGVDCLCLPGEVTMNGEEGRIWILVFGCRRILDVRMSAYGQQFGMGHCRCLSVRFCVVSDVAPIGV